MRILGLDMSSTCIGFALIGGEPEHFGHYDLTDKDIGPRCAAAAEHVAALLDTHRPALVIIESPVARFASAVIAQSRVAGAVIAVLTQRRALWREVEPAVAKKVLAGSGNASKAQMVEAAARRMGINMDLADVLTYRGKVRLTHAGGVLSEDEADAYALALVGQAMKVQTVKEAA